MVGSQKVTREKGSSVSENTDREKEESDQEGEEEEEITVHVVEEAWIVLSLRVLSLTQYCFSHNTLCYRCCVTEYR